MMKKAFSLRTQLVGLMALLVFLQSFALLSSLTLSRVFVMLDAEAFRLFTSATNSRVQSYNTSVGSLVSSLASETASLSRQLQRLAAGEGVEAGEIYRDDDLYTQACLTGAESLVGLLRGNAISGAFFILNGSNADKESDRAHSSVHIRNSAPGTAVDNFLLELGPIAVSQQYGITTSVGWDLDLQIAAEGDARHNYYFQPIWAAAQDPGAEIERYGYWSQPVDLLGGKQKDIAYTMPLLDAEDKPYGVLGISISLTLFNQRYLPNADLPYNNSFFAIAPVRGDVLELEWFIPSGPLAQVYLQQETSLPLEAVSGSDLWETHLPGLGDMYCSAHPLQIYSRNSPFYDDSWSLVSLVPKQVLHQTSDGVRTTLVASIFATTALSFAAIFLLAYLTTRKISGLSKYVEGLTPYMDIHFEPTRIREIDELTAAVEMLNKSVVNASKTTSKILELTLLPIGGYEVSDDTGQVVLTEFLYTLLSIEPGTIVSAEQWAEIHHRLVADPAPGYEDIFRYDTGDEQGKWLRIVEAESESGQVGVILDVSKDIEEHRRLAHELDYDALTRLLNRTAFKREAHKLIQSEPDLIGAMLFVDLDNLKYINDTFGHDMGDRLIMRAGEMLHGFERHGGVVSRISGDEFAIYLHGYSSKEEAKALIYRQYRENEDYSLSTPDGEVQRIRYSSGIAFYPDDSGNVTDLLKLADFAMYEAKHNRKGSIYEFNKDTYRDKAYLLENREAINRLLDEGLIRFAFQPIVDLKTGEVYAYEALMRPLLDNFKSPLEILSVAEAQSKLAQLERLVMMSGFEVASSHQEQLGGAKLFLNSIPSQTLSEEDHTLLRERYAHVFGSIVIEITEAENASPARLKEKLDFIRESRMEVAIDDYGSGYSNELRMLALNPNIVKVDIELISNIDTDPDKQKLVSNLIAFCRTKDILTIAEGAETRAELAEVIRLGVDYVQGYYIAKPQFEFADIPEKVRREILYLRDALPRPGQSMPDPLPERDGE